MDSTTGTPTANTPPPPPRESLDDARLALVLGNLRAVRNRLDVPSLDSITWDDLADVDTLLGEAVDEVKQLQQSRR